MKKIFKKIVNVVKDLVKFTAKVILWVLSGTSIIVAILLSMVLFPLVAIFNAIAEGETVKGTFEILCDYFVDLIKDHI